MRILAIHDSSGCAWYRIIQPLLEFRKHGYDVTFVTAHNECTPYDEKQGFELTRNFSGFDLVVGQRVNKYDGLSVWRRGRTPFSRLVYENDDDLFNVTQENWQAFQHYQRTDVREAVIAACEVSDLVTVSTDRLKAIHDEFNPNTIVLQNLIPAYVLNQVRTERKRPRVGWVGGASHGRDVHLATPSVRRFLKRFPEWDLYLGGVDFRPSFKVARDRAFHEPWIKVTDKPGAYYESIDFDIGICPLIDTEFAKSKSYIKALEYMARGIPVVASDCAPYNEIVVHGENGFLVRRDHEWLETLSTLAGDSDLRHKMGEAGKATAAEHTIDEHWTRWEQAYSKLYPANWTFGRNV
jgi:glycosyltransferase involved in cell wall biosynthesis